MSSKRVGKISYLEPNTLLTEQTKKFQKRGGINYYDNAMNDDRTIPYDIEDLCIAVDFYVISNSRSNCGNPANDGDSVVAQYSGRGIASYFGGTKTNLKDQGGNGSVSDERRYMTTNFTDISLVNPSGNTSECVGISSISIEYGNMFTPIVHVDFVDVRGASIFAKEEKKYYDSKDPEKKNSVSGVNLLSSLFSFPYPEFVLRVKGYFGDAVSYHLVCSGTDIKFDSNAGNFIISADFAGSLYGALCDIPMTYIASSPYMSYFGKKYWEFNTTDSAGRFYFNDESKQTPMPTFSELETTIKCLDDNLKKTFESYEEVGKYKKLLNTRLLLREAVFPMSEGEPTSKMIANRWYCRCENNSYSYYFVSLMEGSSCNSAQNEKSSNIYDQLVSFYNSVNSINESNVGISIEIPSQMISSKINRYVDRNGVKYLYETFYIEKDANGNFVNPKQASYSSTKSGESEKTNTVSDYCYNLKTVCSIYPVLNYFLEKDNGAYSHLSDNISRISVYEIKSNIDYRNELIKCKNLINSEIKLMKDKINSIKNDELIRLYGYTPSIENINAVSLSHLDTFMSSFYECLSNIESEKTSNSRSLSKLGISPEYTDLPDDYDTSAMLPPFTLYYAPTIKDGKTTVDIVWPTKFSSGLSNLEEIKFIDSLLDAVSMYQENASEFTNTSTNIGNNRYPGSIYDAISNEKNPYSSLLPKCDDKLFVSYVAAVFSLRLYYFIATNGTPDLDSFCYIEAKNFTSVFGKKYSECVLNYLINLVKKNTASYYINLLCGKNLPQKKSERIFDIGITNQNNHGIFTEDSSGVLKYTWHEENISIKSVSDYDVNVNYSHTANVLPIGVFNFSSIAKSFESGESYNDDRYITLTNSWMSSSEDNVDSFLNKDSFKIVENPKCVINLFKDNKINVSLTDSGKTKSLESIYFGTIHQHNDKSKPLFPSDVFYNNGKCTISAKTFSDICLQSSVSGESELFVFTNNIIEPKFSNVYTKNGTYGCNVFLHGVYYNQNEQKRGGVSVSSDVINCSKAYLFLFSIRTNHAGFMQNYYDSSFDRDGFFSYTELLKEGAFYWRLKYMIENSQIDPINLSGLNYSNASCSEIYSTDSVYNEGCEPSCSNGLFLQPNNSGANSFYTSIFDYRGETFDDCVCYRLKVSVSRVNNLIKMFKSWSNGVSPLKLSSKTFSNISTYYELRVSGKSITLSNINSLLAGNGLSVLDKGPRVLYKITNGDSIAIKNGYITNLTYNLPDDKINDIGATGITEYISARQNLIAVLYDVQFVYDSAIHISNSPKKFKKSDFVKCFEFFVNILEKYGYDSNDKEAIEYKNKYMSDDIKLSVYLSLKSIYDRWCCSRQKSYWEYWPLSDTGERKNCISNHFVYMDSYYNKIGQKLIVDMNDVASKLLSFTPSYSEGSGELEKLKNSTVLSFLGSMAEGAGCAFYALPQNISEKAYDDLADIFKPKSFNTTVFSEDTSTFAVIYKSALSEHLKNEDGYEDDGYDLADCVGNINPKLPESLGGVYDDESETVIPCFGVTVGKGNQSYFTNVDFSSSRNSLANSEYAFKAILDVASAADEGSRKVNSVGQDIYSAYHGYSFKVTVTMLGCCQITPLMYFQLNNVPLYHGAYIISSVSHNIDRGQMITRFEGLRLSKRDMPIQPGNLLLIDSLDWGLEGDEEIEEEDTTTWDVSQTKLSIDAYNSDEISLSAVSDTTIILSSITNSYPILGPVCCYYFSYFYTKEYELEKEQRKDGISEEYDKLHSLIPVESWAVESFDEALKFSSSTFETLLKNNDFKIYRVGDLIGDEIVSKTSNVIMNYGEMLVYYASEKYESEIERSEITSKEKDEIDAIYKYYSMGHAKICYCRDVDNNVMDYYTSGISQVTYDSKYLKYFKWKVIIAKKNSCALGVSLTK